jgi:hypothetical protein
MDETDMSPTKPTPLQQQLDWTSRTSVPEVWVEAVRAMVHREYSHLSAEQREGIFKSFGNFYEFLVNHPFPTLATDAAEAVASITEPNRRQNGPHGNSTHRRLGAFHHQYRLNAIKSMAPRHRTRV